jgi:N-acetylmuramoyl-L-alanine amidase
MRILSALLAIQFLALCGFPARAASINGQYYVPLAGWAPANGLQTFWLKRGDIVEAANRTTKLIFNVDSHDAEINGVHVTLSFPVANDHGSALIAQFDLDNTVRPLLFPSRYLEPKKITTICLDPGHGGKDSGNRVGGFFWHNEKTYTLLLAQELHDQLRRAGFKVILTRTRDAYVELPERPALANRFGADLFVSLHFNATQAGKNEVAGPETYCITPVGAASSNAQGEGADHAATIANRVEKKSLLFAYQIQKALVQNLGVNDRSVRRARFAVLRDAAMPAILIEGGYMTNPAENKRIYDAAWRRQMAAAIVKGVLNYQKLAAPTPPPAPPATNHPPLKPSPPGTSAHPPDGHLGAPASRRPATPRRTKPFAGGTPALPDRVVPDLMGSGISHF